MRKVSPPSGHVDTVLANLAQEILRYARGVGRWAVGTRWGGLAGGGCLPILRRNSQEAETTEDERAGDLLLSACERRGRRMPAAIPSRELTNLAL